MHVCDGMPDAVIVDAALEGTWSLIVSGEDFRGYDEMCHTRMYVAVPITHCPFCGEELR